MTTLAIFREKKSMTGKSFQHEFQELDLDSKSIVYKESFDEIIDGIENNSLIGVLPTWNSYAGEIKKAKVLDSLLDKEMRLHHIWPSDIVFSCIIRRGSSGILKNTISVSVAVNQCSDFIKKNKLQFNVPEPDNTVEAYNQFTKNTEIDSVLCNKELCREEEQEVLCENAANELNFTTFVILGKESDDNWPTGTEWDIIKEKIFDKSFQISAIEMPYNGNVLTETQLDTLAKIFDNRSSLTEIPRPIFINRREGGKIGIIFEYSGTDSNIFDIYPDLEYAEELKIVNDGGAIKDSYINRIIRHIEDKDNFSNGQYFWKHTRGSNSYLYLCPVLNIAIHGFEEELVEFMAKHFIIKLFELHTTRVESNDIQKEFFDKYKDDFKNIGIESIQFTEILNNH